MKNVIKALIVVVLFTSCSNVLDKKINMTTGKEDVAKIKDKYKDKYSKEELDYLPSELAKYFIAGALNKEKSVDKTYGEVLEDLHKQKIKYDEEMKVYNDAVKKLTDAVSLTVKNSGTEKGEYGIGDYFVMLYDVKNNSNKNIAAYEGVIEVKTLTGTDLGSYKQESSKTLVSGQTENDGAKWSIFENIYQLESTPIDKLKFNWIPRVVVFEDGQKLTLPDEPNNPLKEPFSN